MDKEPSLLLVLLTCLVLGIGGLILSKYRLSLALISIGIAVMLSLVQIRELRDPLIGSEIVREAGYSYVVQSYVAAVISIVLPFVGLLMKWKSQAKNGRHMHDAKDRAL